MQKRIAVIGAGPSGLAQLRAFQSAATTGAEIPEVVCFEKQATWGGLWAYDWRTGLDANGEPCHSSMFGQMGPKRALNSRIIVLMRILVDPLLLTLRVPFCLIISRVA